MSPLPPKPDAPNNRLVDAKLSGKPCVDPISSRLRPDGANIRFSEFSAPVGGAAQFVLSTFSDHIGHVLSVAANEQMLRIDARSIVTVVANKRPGGDRAVMEFVAHAVSCP